MPRQQNIFSRLFGLATSAGTPGRDYFGEIGVKPFINAAGAYSAFGGARMRPEVVDAMRYAAVNKAKIKELHDAVGRRIAELAGCEAAMVTSGATAAIVLGTAACMTMGDAEKMLQLPDTGNMKNEIIIQKRHRYTYDRALTVAGASLVEVASEQDVRDAVSDKTAMMFFLKPTHNGDNISRDSYLRLSREFSVPSFCDAATTTPPASNVVAEMKHGFDLVCYSGGKGLRGPYSAGLLLGRRDLIEFAKLNSAPNHQSIGRGMKVSAEEYLGMLVALEAGLAISEEQENYRADRRPARCSDERIRLGRRRERTVSGYRLGPGHRQDHEAAIHRGPARRHARHRSAPVAVLRRQDSPVSHRNGRRPGRYRRSQDSAGSVGTFLICYVRKVIRLRRP
jgi:L-seryl-tRNA(Ser) seleniumtransferase